MAALKHTENIAWHELEQLEKAVTPKPSHDKAQAQQFQNYRFRETATAAHSAHELLQNYSPLATQRALLLTGPPGQGKTHTMGARGGRVCAGGRARDRGARPNACLDGTFVGGDPNANSVERNHRPAS